MPWRTPTYGAAAHLSDGCVVCHPASTADLHGHVCISCFHRAPLLLFLSSTWEVPAEHFDLDTGSLIAFVAQCTAEVVREHSVSASGEHTSSHQKLPLLTVLVHWMWWAATALLLLLFSLPFASARCLPRRQARHWLLLLLPRGANGAGQRPRAQHDQGAPAGAGAGCMAYERAAMSMTYGLPPVLAYCRCCPELRPALPCQHQCSLTCCPPPLPHIAELQGQGLAGPGRGGGAAAGAGGSGRGRGCACSHE